MNFIPCTDPCIYQKDGYCTLSRAGSGGNPSAHKGCVHFLPHAASQENRQRLSDVFHRGHNGLPSMPLGNQTLGKAQAPYF